MALKNDRAMHASCLANLSKPKEARSSVMWETTRISYPRNMKEV